MGDSHVMTSNGVIDTSPYEWLIACRKKYGMQEKYILNWCNEITKEEYDKLNGIL